METKKKKIFQDPKDKVTSEKFLKSHCKLYGEARTIDNVINLL